MRVLGIVGWSGSGKTTLIAAVLPALAAAGLRVSTIKHAHAGFDMDRPGKDSYRHREAGAHEVLVVAPERWALLHESGAEAADLDQLLHRLDPVDLVLAEGFKAGRHPLLEVYRPALGRPPLWPQSPSVIAVASDVPLSHCDRTSLPLADPAAVSRWVLGFARTGATGPGAGAVRSEAAPD
ncbi:MAG: molybdopterin-guanine dinucleotide biosynthesis protein B [Proteobacteria bacterium]|nr:molybdopterin-guanine dinucleotide biosynthesis protein B [Pseudomonadota bacterium]